MNTMKIVAALSISLFFMGCQSTAEKISEEIIETNKQTEYLSEAKVSIDALQVDIEKSKQDNLSYFSPDIYEKAIEEYQNAFSHYTDIITNGHSSLSFSSKTEQYEEAKLTILTYISKSKQKLKLAYSIKSTAEVTLAETFSQKQRLDELKVSTLYARDYKDITEEIDELVEMIAEGDVTEAQTDQPKLLSKMVAIEVRAVKQIELGKIEQQISQIKKLRKNKYVPISYQRLLMARNKASSTITTNPRDVEGIKIAVEATKYQLAHVNQLANEVSKLKNTKSKYYEGYILGFENDLAKIATAIGLGGIKNLTFTKQVAEISDQSIVLKQNLSVSQTGLADLQGSNEQATTALEKQKEQFAVQLQALDSKNQALEEGNLALQTKLSSVEIELIKLQAYKEAIDSVNQAELMKAQARNVANAQAPVAQAKKLPDVTQQAKTVEENAVNSDVVTGEEAVKAGTPVIETTAETTLETVMPAVLSVKELVEPVVESVNEVVELTEDSSENVELKAKNVEEKSLPASENQGLTSNDI